MEEKLKQSWRDTQFSTGQDPDRMTDIINGRRKTALESLARRYRIFSYIAFAMAVVSVNFAFNSVLFGTLAPWVALVMVIFFLVCGIIDDQFCRAIKSIDLTAMPVAEVADKARLYRKRHLITVAVLMPLALTTVGFMAYATTGEPSILLGMTLGGFVGLAIGMRQLKIFLNDYKCLSD